MHNTSDFLSFIKVRRINPIEFVNKKSSGIWRRRPFLPKPEIGEREQARITRRRKLDVMAANMNPAWK